MKRTLPLMALLLCSTMLFAGCGGGDDDASASTSATSQAACKSLNISGVHIAELFDSGGNRLGARGPGQVRIEGVAFDAVITIVRLGPFNVVQRAVIDYLTLDFGSRGLIEASLKGDFDASGFSATPPKPAFFDGEGTVENGTGQFERASGTFYIFFSNDGIDTKVDILNGKLCHTS